ncbi:phage major capsid protein [Hymenobacter sublimis]|uniref:Phage major capsid protein n=1 Tax=Hymenobacter sublimis TaxID=2933777 RepID=A0ABY4JEZ0_9BACT|nr:phage major capsid protein [Hymenobacter sublimis]UPL50523.1 phage major capsid protein [Hymenobacter sublimis]
MEHEVKSAIEIANEIKSDVTKQVNSVQEKINADLQLVQKSIDAVAAEQKRSAMSNAQVEVKSLETVVAEKTAEIKSLVKGGKAVEVKAPVDMLRGNTGVSTSQNDISRGGYIQQPNRLTHVRDFMRIGKLATPTYVYDRELLPEGKPALTAEGTRKPKVSFKTEPVTANGAKLAMHYKVSTETAHDAPALTYSFQGKGVEMVLVEEDAQLLYGSGANGEIQGLFPLAIPFNAGSLRVSNAQTIDVIRAAVNQVRKSMYRANVVFMHPDDVTALELTKDADGRYILPNIFTSGVNQVSRIQIAEIDAMNPGEFLVANLDLAVETFMIEDLSIKISDSNEDDFVTNKITVVIEERLLQAVVRPSALVKGTFAAAKAALSAAPVAPAAS